MATTGMSWGNHPDKEARPRIRVGLIEEQQRGGLKKARYKIIPARRRLGGGGGGEYTGRRRHCKGKRWSARKLKPVPPISKRELSEKEERGVGVIPARKNQQRTTGHRRERKRREFGKNY